jgi:hypothetical protein
MRVKFQAVIFLAGVAMIFGWTGGDGRLAAQPINPMAYKQKFDEARKTADVVADVRVLAVVCTEVAGEGKSKSVNLQLAFQVLDSEKGPIKKNEVIVVAHKVNLPSGPGPGSYGFWGAVRQCPTTAGIKGSVALKWDKESNRYTVVAGWVPEPNLMATAIPTEVGKAFVAAEPAAPK